MKVGRNGAGKNSLFSTCLGRTDPLNHISNGEVAEWSNAAVLKTVERESVPRVRIPVSPPLAPAKAFSPSGWGQIFPLFSRVMPEGLSTGSGTRWAGSGLSGAIFSGPDDCAGLVFRL